MKYVYFVSYTFDNISFGNVETFRNKKITTIKDLADLSKVIIENINLDGKIKINNCVVLNYKLLRTEDE
jgi:hypothetical protein